MREILSTRKLPTLTALVLMGHAALYSSISSAAFRIGIAEKPEGFEAMGVTDASEMIIGGFGEIEYSRSHTVLIYPDGERHDGDMRTMGIARVDNVIKIFFRSNKACAPEGEVAQDFTFDSQPIRGIRLCRGGRTIYIPETESGSNYIFEKLLAAEAYFFFESPEWSSFFSNIGFENAYKEMAGAL